MPLLQVIIYDCDWNPQNDLQAQARCHRIAWAAVKKRYRKADDIWVASP